jgi:hypothetical protein
MAMDPTTSYSLDDMLGDVRHGIWSELSASRVSISADRRSLQLIYLSDLDSKINPRPITPKPTSGLPADAPLEPDIRSMLRGELIDLRGGIDRALPHASDRDTRLHLLDARARISRTLDPR